MILKDKEINKDKTEFDSYFSPHNLFNQEVARERNLIYDERKGFYVDEDGCLIRDRLGQEL